MITIIICFAFCRTLHEHSTRSEAWRTYVSNAGFWEVVFILQRQKCPSKLITHVYKQSWWHSVHCRCCRFMPGFRASTVSCRMQLMKLARMMPFEIFVCCILIIIFYWNVSENGDMKTPQTPPPWRHWKKYWSHWINSKHKQMDINVLESWIFQYGGCFMMMSKCSILGLWFLFFQNSLMKSQYFTVMKIHFSDGVLHSDSCITGWIDMDLHCFRKSAAKVF